MSTFQLALTLFIVADPIGNVPIFLSLLKGYDFKKQQRILLREGIIGFVIAIFFQYFGELFLSFLNIHDYTMTITGGLLIIIIALEMIFPRNQQSSQIRKQEPFIVPIAIPLLSGAGTLSLIMLFAKEGESLQVTLAIIFAWIGILAIMVLAPYLLRILGKRGLLALEQLMGMILAIIGCTVLINGIQMYIAAMGIS